MGRPPAVLRLHVPLLIRHHSCHPALESVLKTLGVPVGVEDDGESSGVGSATKSETGITGNGTLTPSATTVDACSVSTFQSLASLAPTGPSNAYTLRYPRPLTGTPIKPHPRP